MITATKQKFDYIIYEPGRFLVDRIKDSLRKSGMAYVKQFPTTSSDYVLLAEELGTPLLNYASKSTLQDKTPDPVINQVKIKKIRADEANSVRYVSGNLNPHNARSWLNPRPSYFSMLMISPGWVDTRPGNRGESKIVKWQSFFKSLQALDSKRYSKCVAVLMNTDIKFSADNVKEETLNSPLIYLLPDAKSEFDYGVRLKQDLLEKFCTFSDSLFDTETYYSELKYFIDAVRRPNAHTYYIMEAGDLIIMDNNRYAHGRYPMVNERLNNANTIELNPRELWSLTIS
jgi:hypothetical protein